MTAFVGTEYTADSHSSSLLFDLPSGATTGDLLIAVAALYEPGSHTHDFTSYTGWTYHANELVTWTDVRFGFFSRVMQLGDTSFTFDVSMEVNGLELMVLAYRGVSAVETVEGYWPSDGQPRACPDIHVDDVPAWLVAICQEYYMGASGYSPPTGYTEDYDSAPGDWRYSVNHKMTLTDGDTGTATIGLVGGDGDLFRYCWHAALTMSAGFTPILGHWRWYQDDAAEPTIALANEDTTWAPTAAYLHHGTTRLRVQVRELLNTDSGALGTLDLQYSTDQSNWTTVGALPSGEGTTQSSKYAHHQYTKATAGAAVSGYLLTASDQAGTYMEAAADGGTLNAGARKEFDLGVAVNWPPPCALYFRLTYGGVVLDGLMQWSAAVRSSAVTTVPFNATAGAVAWQDWGMSAFSRAWVDQYGATWVFGHLRDDPVGVHYWRLASGVWSVRHTLAVSHGILDSSRPYDADVTTSAYVKDYPDRSVVAVTMAGWNPDAWDEYYPDDLFYRRGWWDGDDTDITWGDEVCTGLSAHTPTQVIIDQGNWHWLVYQRTGFIVTCRSTTQDDGSAEWFPTFSDEQRYAVAGADWPLPIAAVPLGSGSLLIVYNCEDALLRSVEVYEGTYHSPDDSIVTDADPFSWGLCFGQSQVHLVYADTATDHVRKHMVYDPTTHAWTSGATMDATAWNDAAKLGMGLVTVPYTDDCVAIGLNSDRADPTKRHVDIQYYSAVSADWSSSFAISPEERNPAAFVSCGPPVVYGGKVGALLLATDGQSYTDATAEYWEHTLPRIMESGHGQNQGTSATASVGLPAGVAENDVLVAVVHVNTAANTITDDNGATPFTQSVQEDNDTDRYAIMYRKAGASEPSTYQWTLDSSASWSVVLRCFRGVDPTTAWHVAPAVGTRSTGTGVVATAPSMTTTEDDCMGLVIALADDSAYWQFSSPSGGYTTPVSNSPVLSPVAGMVTQVYLAPLGGADTYAAVTLRHGSAGKWLAHQVALLPAPPPDNPDLAYYVMMMIQRRR